MLDNFVRWHYNLLTSLSLTMNTPRLHSLGLSSTETSLYDLLLKLGEVPAADIIRQSGMKRPTVYKALYSLEKKGLVQQKDLKKKIHFRPASPTLLLEQAESRYQEASQARNMLQSVMPSLLTTYTLSVERPVVRVYEGVEGVKKAHFEILEEKKEIKAYVFINEEIDRILSGFWSKYYTYRKSHGIFAKVISPNTKGAIKYQKNDQLEFRQTRLVPYEKFPLHLEKNICGDKVAFFAMTEQKELIATVIQNSIIAEAESAGFNLAWEKAELYNESLSLL